MNAIRTEQTHQAYLFTGSRGIGKTSIARILSKAIRCSNRVDESGWLKSCDACSNCKEITSGSSLDVLEIDGASNNGVDSIRDIREQVKFLPASGSKKITIIDEVHMLTTAAFNALLKTLEEPPAHIHFILATTEPHKIPATILSRCQRFDFKRPSVGQIHERLSQVIAAEKIEAEPGAIALLARAAEGSLRDALSLLDQAIVYCSGKLQTEAVRESVGLVPNDLVLSFLAAVLEKRAPDALALIERAQQDGHDFRVLTKHVIEALHSAIVACVTGMQPAMSTFSSEDWERLRSLSTTRSIEEMELIFQVFHHGLDWIAKSPQPKIVLDILAIKCAMAEALVPMASLEKTPISVVSPPPAILSPPPSWESFVAHVTQARPLLGALLEHACTAELPSPETGKYDLLIFFLPEEMYKLEQLRSRSYIESLANMARERFGEKTQVRIETRSGALGESLALKRETAHKKREEAALAQVESHPVIREAKALFGGELEAVHFL